MERRMSIPPFELKRAASVADACALLADPAHQAQVIAGGTQLLLAMKNRTRLPDRLVDLGDIPGLDTLRYDAATGLTIGARVTLAHLADAPEVARHYPVIREAALAVGTLQLQTMGTVAGNLCQDTCCLYVDRAQQQRQSIEPCHKLEGDCCHVVSSSDSCWANYAGDMAPVLMALDASVTVANPTGEVTRPLAALFTHEGVRPNTLSPGEMITAIHVAAPPPRSGATYLKLRQRQSLDYALMGVAAAVTLAEDGTCRSANVVLTGVDRGPVVVEQASTLEGQPLGIERIEAVAQAACRQAHPVKNAFGFGPAYRVKMIVPFVTRALSSAAARAEGREVTRG